MCFTFRQLGTHYPDHALAVISAAGWIKKEDYGESNLFFRHDISTSHTSPAVKGILEACTAENDADKHVSNLHVSYYFVLFVINNSLMPNFPLQINKFKNQVAI